MGRFLIALPMHLAFKNRRILNFIDAMYYIYDTGPSVSLRFSYCFAFFVSLFFWYFHGISRYSQFLLSV